MPMLMLSAGYHCQKLRVQPCSWGNSLANGTIRDYSNNGRPSEELDPAFSDTGKNFKIYQARMAKQVFRSRAANHIFNDETSLVCKTTVYFGETE